MKKITTIHKRQGFTLIEVLIVIAIIGLLATFSIPHLMQAHNKGKAAKIVTDLRAIRNAALNYNISRGQWPRSRTWGRIPPEFVSYLPPSASFDLPSWDLSYAYSNYASKSAQWIGDKGYTVILRARVYNIMLANAIRKLAPSLFSVVSVNRTRGMFTIILE
ncbi:MAG: prepilin-type N-terminal cleavage/methylation domain-containing protein [Candidatus Aminicenantes bacterium]|nr:prepilin-type N-terminal cleavage/methylation domain-containing protein [Candidatus Aminicenantes bacterium]